jgi:transcriptional regulator GlxA family with amidase domain
MRTIAMILGPGFQVMNLAALTVFEIVNMNAEQAVYDIQLLSEEGGLVRSSMGTPIATQPFSDSPSTRSFSAAPYASFRPQKPSAPSQ